MRFVPDTWFDAALRPLLMADPVHGMYVEIAAPDVRFAVLGLALLVLFFRKRHWAVLAAHQGQALLALGVCFYVWTAISGNGRYFVWGLLLVGPALVMVVRQLPGTLALRNTVLLGVLALQGVGIWLNFVPNVWSLRAWREGPGFALQASPLREQPATFLTAGSISYSALVPQMHPLSRWANITGQLELRPGMREYPALRELLLASGPKYLVVRANSLVMGPDGQPLPKVWQSIEGVLARQHLRLVDRHCQYLRSGDAEQAFRRDAARAVEEGFWFCPLRVLGSLPRSDALLTAGPAAPEFDDVFAQVERRCPRLFKPGSAASHPVEGAIKRRYSAADVSLFVDNTGDVFFKHDRALNPTNIGSIERVRQGQFVLECERLAGRYQPPWRRH